jgi:hypothetical protein
MAMVSELSQGPFEELPEALVEDFLNKNEKVCTILKKQFNEMNNSKEDIRRKLIEEKILKKDADYMTLSNPTCCGTDGSYIIENLVSCDLVAIAGVSVEGLTPPSEKRHWPSPKHISEVVPISHNADNSSVARAIMMTMELDLAAKAPHDIIFIDGSLASPAIFLNSGFGAVNNLIGDLKEICLKRGSEALLDYEKILTSKRTDQVFIGVPKASSRKEVAEKIRLNTNYDDKCLLTFILEPGEFVGPIKFSEEEWHINLPKELRNVNNEETVNKIKSLLNKLHVIYYRPYSWMPVIRFEITESVAKDDNRIGLLLRGIKFQCTAPGIFEPYPTYLADRMVKHLNMAIPTIRKSAMQDMLMEDKTDSPNIFLSMHNYRTKSNK